MKSYLTCLLISAPLLINACGGAGSNTGTTQPTGDTQSLIGVFSQDDRWEALIEINCLDPDALICGQIEYRALSCGGALTYLLANQTHAVFSQEITFGTCVQSCELHVLRDGSEYTEYCDGEETDTGVLSRVD